MYERFRCPFYFGVETFSFYLLKIRIGTSNRTEDHRLGRQVLNPTILRRQGLNNTLLQVFTNIKIQQIYKDLTNLPLFKLLLKFGNVFVEIIFIVSVLFRISRCHNSDKY